jgi:hypothetical protein
MSPEHYGNSFTECTKPPIDQDAIINDTITSIAALIIDLKKAEQECGYVPSSCCKRIIALLETRYGIH